MSRAYRTPIVVAVAGAIVAAGSVYAFAGWNAPTVSARMTMKVAKMPRGTQPSVVKADKQAVVSWSAQRVASGARMLSYVVTAHSVTDTGRPDVVRTVTASGLDSDSVTFTSAEVAGSKWRWTVVPRYHSWAGEESKPSEALKFAAAAAAVEDVEDPVGRAAPPERPPAATTPSAAPAKTQPTPSETKTTAPAKEEPPKQEPPKEEPATEEPPAQEPPGESESPPPAAE